MRNSDILKDALSTKFAPLCMEFYTTDSLTCIKNITDIYTTDTALKVRSFQINCTLNMVYSMEYKDA